MMLTLAVLALSLQDGSQWTFLYKAGNGEIWHIDARSPKANGDNRITWLMSDLSAVKDTKARRRVARVEIDCKNEGYTITQSVEYLPNGESLATKSFPYTYISPTSMMRRVLTAVCPQ